MRESARNPEPGQVEHAVRREQHVLAPGLPCEAEPLDELRRVDQRAHHVEARREGELRRSQDHRTRIDRRHREREERADRVVDAALDDAREGAGAADALQSVRLALDRAALADRDEDGAPAGQADHVLVGRPPPHHHAASDVRTGGHDGRSGPVRDAHDFRW